MEQFTLHRPKAKFLFNLLPHFPFNLWSEFLCSRAASPHFSHDPCTFLLALLFFLQSGLYLALSSGNTWFPLCLYYLTLYLPKFAPSPLMLYSSGLVTFHSSVWFPLYVCYYLLLLPYFSLPLLPDFFYPLGPISFTFVIWFPLQSCSLISQLCCSLGIGKYISNLPSTSLPQPCCPLPGHRTCRRGCHRLSCCTGSGTCEFLE